MNLIESMELLTTSIHAHPLASLPRSFPDHRTRNTVPSTPSTSPQNMPSTARLTFCVLPTVNPQICGKNCEYMITHISAPCAANKKSLNLTVVSGASGCLYAYWARMVGEYRKLAVDMV